MQEVEHLVSRGGECLFLMAGKLEETNSCIPLRCVDSIVLTLQLHYTHFVFVTVLQYPLQYPLQKVVPIPYMQHNLNCRWTKKQQWIVTNLKSLLVIFPGFVDKRNGILPVLMQPAFHTRTKPVVVLRYHAYSGWYFCYDWFVEELDLGVKMLVIISEAATCNTCKSFSAIIHVRNWG